MLREKNTFVTCQSRYRMCKSIWQILSDLGRKSIIINDPVTFPPEEINGIMVTGMLTPPGSINWIYPSRLRNEINTVAGGYECDIPPQFLSILQRNRANAAALLERLAVKAFRVSKYVAANYDWDVLATIFTTTDRLQHYWWQDGFEISKHYKLLDAMLHEYVKYANDLKADLMVVSDHGFGPATNVFQMANWLESCGLMVYRESYLSRMFYKSGLTRDKVASLRGAGRRRPRWLKLFDSIPYQIQDLLRRVSPQSRRVPDPEGSIAYTHSGSLGVFLNDMTALDFVVKKLLEARDEHSGKQIFEKIFAAKDELWGPYAYRAADLFTLPIEGYDLSLVRGGGESERTGTHRQEGIFIHYRPNSRPATASLGTVRPWDVAASLLENLGLPVPSYFDGKPRSAFV